MNDFLSNKFILAPLTKGGNLPFRRLCVAFGADATVSEMAYARFVAKGDKRERALLRKHPSEELFGVQFAVIDAKEAIPAAQIAIERGAQFIDINCGCPIEDTTRRGLGAAVLRKGNVLARLVTELTQTLPIPVTVKIRLGWNEKELNYLSIAQKVSEAGAAALTVHGRTREQRYTRSADWDKIREVREAVPITVIGNGDILTHYEAEARKAQSGVTSLLIGRGALIKPWLFQELKEGRTLNPSPSDEIEIYYRLAQYMKEHFGDDELGMKRIMKFLPWHFNFFHRYQYLPQEEYGAHSLEHPLIQSRFPGTHGEDPILEKLRSSSEKVHTELALILLTSASESEAVERIKALEIVEGVATSPNDRSDDLLEAAG